MESRSGGSAGERRGVDDKALTRQRLVDAASAEFEEHGYVHATVERIARRARVRRSTFYSHFAGKAELAEGLWDVARVALLGLYRELARAEQRDRVLLATWLRKTFAFYRRNRRRLLAVHEAIALEPELATVYFEHTEEIVGILVALRRFGAETAERGARTRITLLLVQHERFCFLAFLRAMPFDEDEALRSLTEAWFQELGTT